jgi:hypothetical protein
MRAALLGERRQVLLARFERIHLGAGRAFGVHRKPDRPNHHPDHPDHAGSDVLRDLGVIFVGELFGLDIVGLDLGADHGAVALRVLRLHHRNRMRITPRAGRQHQSQRHHAQVPAAQDTHPQPP